MVALKPKTTTLKIGLVTYQCYKITPPRPKLEGIETTSLADDVVMREPGDVLDLGESIEAELVYADATYIALKALQTASSATGAVSECSIVYADLTHDDFKGWVMELGKSEVAVKGEPIKLLLTLGIAGPAAIV